MSTVPRRAAPSDVPPLRPGERLKQPDVVGCERTRLAPGDGDHADRGSFAQQRNVDQAAEAT